MNSQPLSVRPADVWQYLAKHPVRSVAPLLVTAVLSAVFVLVNPETWDATQALVVRDEAVRDAVRPGRFKQLDEMKTAQETVMELVKTRGVLAAALTEVGPPADYRETAAWPSDRVIDDFRSNVKLLPPKGAEFGKTEVFYLKVSARQRQRAVDLASALCRQLKTRFEELRVSRYESVIAELTNTVALAETDLKTSTDALSQVEQRAGRDLAELRTLNEMPSSDSALRRQANEIESELRTFCAQAVASQEIVKLLQAAEHDPGALLAYPGRLLESQPGLRRLKDGLIDAQLRTASLSGTMSPDHPAVQAALVSEREVGAHLHEEIGIALKALQIDQQVIDSRIAALNGQRAEVQARLARLADVRADYANLLATNRHRADILKTAQQELSEARAGQAAAQTVSLLMPIDQPDTGPRPAGPGRLTLLLAGCLGGLVLSAGLVFLSVQPVTADAQPAEAVAPVAIAASVAPVDTTPQPLRHETTVPPLRAVNLAATLRNSSVPQDLSLKQALQRLTGAASPERALS